ncbi:hypothetical protein H6G33_30995 [Calothrix sp. FACHB-1219]|uniref:hypothetical protein n=1 Tax=unclassified Calothrix TaxID=2619626 RepID=UPI0016874FAB|nr:MULTISPECIES: hypothetical protein [unclassified Calothrix]MBD2206606.1 hypothetical protein [Calothrix sp. FACHB-168]MBD2221401.1 hypothetical protein [Calothrix sp. FACHB-1219]
MLQSYEAILENGQVKWLTDEPKISKARVIVTILSDTTPQVSRRTPPKAIAGKGKTLGDLVSPIIEEQDWECLK